MKKYIYFSLIAVFAMMIYGGSYFLNKSYSAVTGSLNFDSLEFQNLPVNPSTDGIDRELGVRVFSLRRSSDPVELISAFCGKAGKSIHKGGYTAVEVDSYFANSPNKEKIKKVIYLFNPVPAYNYEENDSRMSDTLDAFKN